jgi:lipoyl(octanoyl) transferase
MVEWITSNELVDFREAEAWMEERASLIAANRADECIWLVEHPPLYSAGTSAKIEDLTDPTRFPVFETRRGGQYTYHGPGQRVVYVMLDVGKRGRDVRRFVQDLESWVIETLKSFTVSGEIKEGRVGVWVERHDNPLSSTGDVREDKIAAIGIRLRKWISFHGIIPCGIQQHGVTSLVDLGLPVAMEDVDIALKKQFASIFPDLA